MYMHPINLKSMPGIFLLFAFNMSFAQDSAKSSDEYAPLLKLDGYSQTYYYSPDQEARATTLAEFMESAIAYFHGELDFTPEIKMFILAPRHWKEFAAKPLQEVYGFPHNIDKVRLAIAAEDNDFWRSFLPEVNTLSPEVAEAVRQAYGTPDGSYSMMPFFDLLAVHEMGHSYTAQGGLNMHRHWMSELFVNIMLHTFIAEKRPELLPALETFPEMVVGGGSAGYEFTSLEDFERLYPTLGMGPKNYGWYQTKLHGAAKDIYNAGGEEVMINLWEALKRHQEEMTDAQFAEMLKEEVHPAVADVYLNWGEGN